MKKHESITTASANVPGQGPIAASQNGLCAKPVKNKIEDIIQTFIDDYDKYKTKANPINEHMILVEGKITVNEIIDALNGENEILKLGKNYNEIWNKVKEQLADLEIVLGVKSKDIPYKEIQSYIKKIV